MQCSLRKPSVQLNHIH